MTNTEILIMLDKIIDELLSRMDENGETTDQKLQDSFDIITSLIDYFKD